MRHSIKGVVAVLAMSAGLTASVMADVVSTQPVFTKKGRGITVIPGDFLIDGRPQIMISDIDSLSTTLRLYDMDFARLDDVVVPHAERLGNYLTEVRSLTYSWPVVTTTKWLEDMPLSEAMNYYIPTNYGSGEIVTKESDGGTDIYLRNDKCVLVSWWQPGVGEGKEAYVPYMEYIYKVWFRFEPYDTENPEGNGVLYVLEGEGDAPDITLGEWVTASESYYTSTYAFGAMEFISDKGKHANCSLTVTQNLFNEDDEYEYIGLDWEQRSLGVKEGEGVEISGEYIPLLRYTSYDVVHVGFSVKKADGTTIQSVRFPEEFANSGTLNFTVLELGDRRYLCCESTSEVIIYAIDDSGAGLRQVGSPISARVFPTIVNRGEPISIERGDVLDEVRVSVYSGDGTRRYSGGMKPGEQLKTLPTSGLPGGLNIVTLEDGSNRESKKILVK